MPLRPVPEGQFGSVGNEHGGEELILDSGELHRAGLLEGLDLIP